ncbi:ferredoxin family protein [Pelagibacteraceae bacterium]|jgi:ferredoxin|nr:ferredoxin family protein [Pelagibacteraceae bacterium]
MTYIVNQSCIKCKLMDCVEVCPVDCFYEGENMLVIKPDECIDCGVCEPECPISAIEPDTNEGAGSWVEINKKYSEMWPNITKKRENDVPQDQDKWRDVKDKLKYLSEKSGKGD